MRFEFATATRIVFGAGAVRELPALAESFGKRALVITGSRIERAQEALGAGPNQFWPVAGEPTLEIVRQGAKAARDADFVIGFGGGSVIDAAKAIAALAANSGEPLDYVEVIGKGRPLENTPLPFIAVPTTAGTGAEVTRNAVLGSPEQGVKASLRSPLLLAKVALVDPDLTMSVPPAVTAATGLDTLTQLIEPFVSVRANDFTDMFCLEGMRRAIDALPLVVRDGQNRQAREEMAFASLLSGLALANAGLGVVHGFAAPLGGMLSAPHGALCAAVLPYGTEMNVRALRERAPTHPALEKYRRVAMMLLNDPQAKAEAAAGALRKLCAQLNISGLRAHGLDAAQIPALVEKAAVASSMKANPIVLSASELTEITERSL